MRGASLLSIVLAGAPASAQSVAPVSALDAFVTSVRAATERYRDQSAAVADGYRPIGPDFPSMGEHWVSIPLVVRDEVDPRRPPILEYITIGGRPTLAGVAYTQLIREGRPRASIPAPASAWHYHSGSVDEESFILGHAEGTAEVDPMDRPKVAVLHAWLWLENPAGLFTTDNWALPWHRLGVDPPPESEAPTPGAMMAALATGGQSYFLTLLRLRERLSSEDVAHVAQVLEDHGKDWGTRLEWIAGQGLPLPVTDLTADWSALQEELRRICDGCTLSPHAGHP